MPDLDGQADALEPVDIDALREPIEIPSRVLETSYGLLLDDFDSVEERPKLSDSIYLSNGAKVFVFEGRKELVVLDERGVRVDTFDWSDLSCHPFDKIPVGKEVLWNSRSGTPTSQNIVHTFTANRHDIRKVLFDGLRSRDSEKYKREHPATGGYTEKAVDLKQLRDERPNSVIFTGVMERPKIELVSWSGRQNQFNGLLIYDEEYSYGRVLVLNRASSDEATLDEFDSWAFEVPAGQIKSCTTSSIIAKKGFEGATISHGDYVVYSVGGTSFELKTSVNSCLQRSGDFSNKNFAFDENGLLYYAISRNVHSIERHRTVDNTPDAKIELPKIYPEMKSLRVTKDGAVAFFVCEGEMISIDLTVSPTRELISLPNTDAPIEIVENPDVPEMIIVRTIGRPGLIMQRNPLMPLGTLPDGFQPVHFHSMERVDGISPDGHLVTLELGIHQVANEMARRDRLISAAIAEQEHKAAATRLKDLDLGEMMTEGQVVIAEARAEQLTNNRDHLDTFQSRVTEQVRETLAKMTSLEEIEVLSVERMRKNLAAQAKLSAGDMDYVMKGAIELIHEKRREFIEPRVLEILDAVEAATERLTIDNIPRIREQIKQLRAFVGEVSGAIAGRIEGASLAFTAKGRSVYKDQEAEVRDDINDVVRNAAGFLEDIEDIITYRTWYADDFPDLIARVNAFISGCPDDNHDLKKHLREKKDELISLAEKKDRELTEHYAEIRHKAEGNTVALKNAILSRFTAILERFRRADYPDRRSAERAMLADPVHTDIMRELRTLGERDTQMGKAVRRTILSEKATLLDEVELRAGAPAVDDSGRQMVTLGSMQVAINVMSLEEEAKPNRVSLVFIPDKSSRGPGIKAKDWQGWLGLRVAHPDGKTEEIKLGESLGSTSTGTSASDWDTGMLAMKGVDMEPIYMTAAEAKKIIREVGKTARSKNQLDALKTEHDKLMEAVSEAVKATEITDAAGKRTGRKPDRTGVDAALTALGEFRNGKFTHVLGAMRRAERPDSVEDMMGRIPDWNSYWTRDAFTEYWLGELAETFQMQQDSGKGLAMLAGHAGTGKDVLVQMYCHLTNRPYFAFNATRWTRESDLYVSLELQVEDGSVVTHKIPSVIIQGMQVPGAVVYVNEFNAMPEAAQLALHSLFDGKRTAYLTDGTEIKAAEGVVFAGSMNPGYKGTNEPNLATMSRIKFLRVGYPPLVVAGPASSGRKVYSSSEACRVARSVDSLSDLTFGRHNAFSRQWDAQINSLPNPNAQEDGVLTKEEEYDMEVVFGLIKYTDVLRTYFDRIMKGKSDGRQAAKQNSISQPVTMRSLASCAWYLSNRVPVDVKSGNWSDREIKDMVVMLLEKFYLDKLDPIDADQVVANMRNDAEFNLNKAA
jgi:hypothetical protein